MANHPVCATCMIAMSIKVTGATLIEMFCFPPEPYRIWSVDIHMCPVCECRVVSGYADKPLNHFDATFTETWEAIRSNLQAGLYEEEIIFQFERISDAKAYRSSVERVQRDG